MQIAVAARYPPGALARGQQRPHALECAARRVGQRAHRPGREKFGRRAQLNIVLGDDLAKRMGEIGGLGDRRRRVRARHGPPERVGERVVDPPRRSQMIERLHLVETPHLHRPFHRCALAADGQRAVVRARDRHRAAVDCRRIGMIDLELGHAGGLAFGQGGIIEERKAHGALDLESAAAGQEYRRGMGIDPLDRRAAMGCGVAKKIDHRLLRGSGRAHPSSSGWRYYRPDQYRRTDPNQCTPWSDAVII